MNTKEAVAKRIPDISLWEFFDCDLFSDLEQEIQ